MVVVVSTEQQWQKLVGGLTPLSIIVVVVVVVVVVAVSSSRHC